MALGTLGSTLNDELNRLANGGTYRTMPNMVDEALAAKQWANRENINPYSTDTVGILNEIAGLGLDKRNWLDFNGVCNYIAGTTGLPAAAALRQVYPTTDLLTSQASYYIDATDASASGQTITNLGAAGSLLPTTVGSSTAADSNDPKFLDHTGTNYVYTTGVSGNSLSVPDAANLRITGDIDVRAYVALDDWTPSTTNEICSKSGGTGNRGWLFNVSTTGQLQVVYSVDGTALLTRISTFAPTIADGQPLWVRFTLDVDNGASGNDFKFYTSSDGTNWTQLGSTVTNAGTTSIFASTANFLDNGASSFKTGKIFRLQLFAGLDGTDKRADVDTSVITAGSATSFTAVTGQTVTINRSTSGRKTVAVTQPVWLFGTDDYMEVNNRYMSSGTYLYLPGVASNNATTPDAAALDITGDIDLRLKLALDDWTPSALTYLFSKYQGAGNVSYAMSITAAGLLQLNWSAAGTTIITKTSTVAPTVTDGSTLWIRATLDVNNGASGNDVAFYTSTDGITWTQLGTTVTTAGTTSIYAGTSMLEIGSVLGGTSNNARGKFFRAQVLNGIGGTVAFDANFETSITSLNQTSFTESSANAATVTINRSGSAYRSAGITAAGYLYPGATNTFSASATDFLNFGAADSFTLLAVNRDWNNGTVRGLAGKRLGGSGPGYALLNWQSQIGGTDAYISDGTTTVNSYMPSGNTAGLFLTSTMVRDVATDQLRTYSNASESFSGGLSPVTDTTTGAISTQLEAFRIGYTNALYQDGEIYAVALFRSALTLAQVRQISNYFRNREVYL